ncbi:MAG: trypsin-like peptidase domain-containing protein [Oscillospiraceae bacterium]|nr:trypsin-like peptidase domain-containing protein [Oscillospiraceae bacterium]
MQNDNRTSHPEETAEVQTKPLSKHSLTVRAFLIVGLFILLIIGISSIAQLFADYEVRLHSTSYGLQIELRPRIRAEDIVQSPGQVPIPPPDRTPENGIAWNGESDTARMPVAILGDGTTLTLHPIPTYDETGASPQLSFQEIFQKCSPSVVFIEVRLRFPLGSASGTGVIMTENGYIITSAHVIEDARQVIVTLQDGRSFYAAVLGMDENTDIAVLKIDAEGLIPAVFGDSDLLQVGQEVAVIGNPLGHRHSMSNGIISALDREVVYDGITMRLIQTNAAINEGNSGGPLINLYGQVVGITNMKLIGPGTVEGMGFAVPTAQIRPVVDSIIEHGRVVGRPALGIVVRMVDAVTAADEGIVSGVYVQRVLEGTDAYEQGLQVGDRILTANGTRILDSVDLRNEILNFRVGESITLVIERDGVELSLRIRLMDAGLLEF